MLAHREATPQGAVRGTVLCLHGFPQSSYVWRHVLPAVAAAGWRAVAPDLAGSGDSPPDPPGTWAHHVEQLDAFVREACGEEERLVLVLHDWGGLIGLRWACEHPGRVRALVVASTGFFPDGRWHGLADALRTPGTGEALLDSLTLESFSGLLRAVSPAFTDDALVEYWRGFDGMARRRAHLELYRSGDFAELVRYEGCLRALQVPALVLWGAGDVFAPVSGAHRFLRELPMARLEVLEGAGHFVFDEEPEASAALVAGFVGQLEGVLAERDDGRLV